MSDKRRRRWDRLVEDDPLAGLINLFDVWMVFSIALLLALVACLNHLPQTISGGTAKAAGAALEPVSGRNQKLPHYRVSRDEMSGEGVRLGTAYRLKSGDVVYVPDDR
ncbi:MAG: DUF2149 domain-containing protein [Thermoguttaceae bacterium]